MGFFSWKTSDGRSISNVHSRKGTFTVYMVLPDNTRAREDAYEGYGEFGGKDYYEEVSRLNGGDGSRSHGIDIEYGLKPDGGKPILPRFTEDPDAKWEDLKDPENCPKQGYFY